jgi:hypothetical protein
VDKLLWAEDLSRILQTGKTTLEKSGEFARPIPPPEVIEYNKFAKHCRPVSGAERYAEATFKRLQKTLAGLRTSLEGNENGKKVEKYNFQVLWVKLDETLGVLLAAIRAMEVYDRLLF